MNKHEQEKLAEKYCLPSELVPMFIESQHSMSKAEYFKAVNFICKSQIKWLLKQGWQPPKEK